MSDYQISVAIFVFGWICFVVGLKMGEQLERQKHE